MGKLVVGAKVPNSTLSVVKYISDKRVSCKCESCGKEEKDELVSMTFNESDLLSGKAGCRFCSALQKAKNEGYFTERETYMTLLSKNSAFDILTAKVGQRCVVTVEDELGNDAFIKKFPLGNKYGELISVAYMTSIKTRNQYGIQYTVPTHIVLKCQSCGYITFVKVGADLNKVNVCPLCSVLRRSYANSLEASEQSKLSRGIAKSQERDFGQVKTEFSKLSRNKAMQKSVKTLEDKNKGYKVVDITKDGGATTYHLVCEDCGSIVTCMRSNANIGTCKFCEERKQNKDFTKVGYLFKDYIGSIFNGLKVVKQNGLTCTVECIKCHKEREDLDIYGVLGKRYYCDCPKSVIRTECPNCYAPLDDLTYEDVYSGKLPTCKHCNTPVDESELIITIESMDYSNSLRAKLDLANRGISDKAVKKIRFGNKFAVDTLIVEKDSVYKGNNEKSYYRCFCKKHNVGLTLSEDEIMNYACELCDDARQSIIANPDSSSIKLE